MKKTKCIFLIILFALALIFASAIAYSKNSELKVIFLDVGQGDAALIMQGNKQVLIDGGPDGQALMEKLGKYIPFWDRRIELVVATHPDQDHIQGLVDVLEKYQVGSVMETFVQSNSQIYKKYKDLLEQKNINIAEARLGAGAELDENAKLEIIGPLAETADGNKEDTNSESVISKLVFGENTFLLTGDAPIKEEKELLSTAEDLSADILKVAHHGSKYSTSEDFLARVKPKEAIISVGKNNRFGHPSPEILERLEKDKIKIIRTDESGDIIFKCPNFAEDCLLVSEN